MVNVPIMKVLHIITCLNNGGAEGVLYRLSTNDNQNNHQIISLMDNGVFGEKLAMSGIPVHTLNMPHGQITIKSFIMLYRLIRSIRPDVVQTWMYHSNLIGGLAAKLARVNAIVWGVRGLFNDSVNTSQKTQFIMKCCALSSGWIPRRIIFNSMRAAQAHMAKGYSEQKVIIIPNGYNIMELRADHSARVKFRAELGISQNEVLLGMVARWHPQKDHANLISALGLLKNHTSSHWKAVLVGPGITNDNTDLISLLDFHGLRNRIQLFGPCSDISGVMNAIDIHILSSSDGEAFPNVLAESMACGTPCITTDIGDAAFIVSNLGWVVQPGDHFSLSNAITLALVEKQNEPNVWESRKASCRKRIEENFNIEKMVNDFNLTWKKVVTGEFTPPKKYEKKL